MNSNAHIIKNLAYQKVGEAMRASGYSAHVRTSVFAQINPNNTGNTSLGGRADWLLGEHIYNQHTVEDRLQNE